MARPMIEAQQTMGGDGPIKFPPLFISNNDINRLRSRFLEVEVRVLVSAIAAATLLAGSAALGQPLGGGAVKTLQTAPVGGPLAQSGARLGMSLDDWRSLPDRLWPSSHVVPSCVPDSGSTGLSQGATSSPAGVLECSYRARDGKTLYQQSFPLFGSFVARAPSFAFVDGRLSQIRFRTSVDAFSRLDAWFTRQLGPPVQTMRDDVRFGQGFTFPRVRRHWRRGDVDVWLIDPSRRPDQLAVRYGAPGRGLAPPHG